MYNLRGNQPSGSSTKPNWTEVYAKKKEEFEIIKIFKNSLIAFIKVVGPLFSGQTNPIAELLGTVEIDLMQRKQELDKIYERLDE